MSAATSSEGASTTLAGGAAALYEKIRARDPGMTEFLQAAREILASLQPLFEREPKYLAVFERLAEPERSLQFRVVWQDDAGVTHVNRGFRVQYSQTLGPYKGGLRFHPSVNRSILTFLGLEQVLKNSLTGLPMGGGKGGSDFDPKGRSDREVMRFCQAFMTSLWTHLGPDRDVPAGDIGVGGREVGYLFGQYKRLSTTFTGTLTGKGADWGGSLIRPEATGYGAVYYASHMVADASAASAGSKEDAGEAKAGGADAEEAAGAAARPLAGLRVAVSGAGNVAQYAIEKLLDEGAVPITASDSSGYVYEPKGFTRASLALLMRVKNVDRGRLEAYAELRAAGEGEDSGDGTAGSGAGVVYTAGKRPWGEACDVAMPCATQNEIEAADAEALVAGGVRFVVEGANMPSTNEAIEVFEAAGVRFGPAKAANAGGVAVSGLEMSQNSLRLSWTREEVDGHLRRIMRSIYDACVAGADSVGMAGNLRVGANVAGFRKVADAMLAQGDV